MRRKPRKPLGLILWEGPSKLDGAPIVVIATGIRNKSKNDKTGAMIQVWIIRSDLHPMEVAKLQQTKSICGGCPLQDNGCYVDLAKAPAQVYKAYKAGSYKRVNWGQDSRWFAGAFVRFGAYGDPAAAPLQIWRTLAHLADAHTGYTHSWNTPQGAGLVGLVQASCDTPAQAAAAAARGWKYFRTTAGDWSDKRAGEIRCPAGLYPDKVTCLKCLKCDGATKNVMIPGHGGVSVLRKYKATMAALNS